MDNAVAQNSPAKSPSIRAGAVPGRATPIQLGHILSNSLEPYQLPAPHPPILENHVGGNHGQEYEGQSTLQLQINPQLAERTFHEMPAHTPLSPIELPGDFGTIDGTSEANLNRTEDIKATPTIRYTLHAPSSPPPINTTYGEVALGNPYADDDTLATPTPTQEVRNGLGVEGAGYMGRYNFNGANNNSQQVNIPNAEQAGDTYLNDALLQLRFVDETAAEGEAQHRESQGRHPGIGGFGTAI